MNLGGLLSQINFAAPTWDIFILAFFLIVAVLYGLSLGRDRIIVILVSIYMAIAVVATAPFLKNFTTTIAVNEVFAFKVTAFVGIFLFVFFLVSRSGLMRTLGASTHGSWWQVILFSFLHVGLLIATVLSFLPPEVANRLAPITRTIFLSEAGHFAWVVAPILVMALVREEKK